MVHSGSLRPIGVRCRTVLNLCLVLDLNHLVSMLYIHVFSGHFVEVWHSVAIFRVLRVHNAGGVLHEAALHGPALVLCDHLSVLIPVPLVNLLFRESSVERDLMNSLFRPISILIEFLLKFLELITSLSISCLLASLLFSCCGVLWSSVIVATTIVTGGLTFLRALLHHI